MSRRKTVFGITVLSALVLSAFAAANSSASGATAFTCVSDTGGTLFGPHCLKNSTGDNTKYSHIAISPGEATTGTTTNANTVEETKAAQSFKLKAVVFGINLEVTCGQVHGEDTVENRTSGGEMFLHVEGKLHLTGCVVTFPPGKGCKVAGETITTNQLTGKSVGSGGSVKIEPKVGTVLAEFEVEACSISALNQVVSVTGTFQFTTDGATWKATHFGVTEQGGLRMNGTLAGIDGAVTLKAHSKAGEETNPIAPTATP